MPKIKNISNDAVVFAIGDIHGRADLLDAMLERIEDEKTDEAVEYLTIFLGDLVDRGPDSAKVVKTVRNLPDSECIRGNHEVMMVEGSYNWYNNGARPTLNSYGDDLLQLRLDTEWMDRLPDAITNDTMYFVHAGVNPAYLLSAQHENDLHWIRFDFLQYAKPFAKYIVHGHTPVQFYIDSTSTDPDIQLNRLNLDTGAYASGVLTCAMLQYGKVIKIFQTKVWNDNNITVTEREI